MDNSKKKKLFKAIEKHINSGWLMGKTESKDGYGTVKEILEAVKQYNKEKGVHLKTRVTPSNNVIVTDRE